MELTRMESLTRSDLPLLQGALLEILEILKPLVYTNDQGEIVKGVCSNFLCDLKPRSEVKLTGPLGKENAYAKGFKRHCSSGHGLCDPVLNIVVEVIEARAELLNIIQTFIVSSGLDAPPPFVYKNMLRSAVEGSLVSLYMESVEENRPALRFCSKSILEYWWVKITDDGLLQVMQNCSSPYLKPLCSFRLHR